MSLINDAIPVPGAPPPALDRAIRATSTSQGQLLYTVPAGRKFSGYATGATASLSQLIAINGTATINQVQANPNTYPLPVYLNAGDTVHSGQATACLFGIESDA